MMTFATLQLPRESCLWLCYLRGTHEKAHALAVIAYAKSISPLWFQGAVPLFWIICIDWLVEEDEASFDDDRLSKE